MYNIIKFIENIGKFLKIKLKIFCWKLKYGKRIKIGKKFRFRKSLIINISKTGYLEIGNNNSFNNNCSINCHQKIKIGDNNMFGENVKIYDHNHVFNNKSIDRQKTYIDSQIFIGNNNWFGSDVLILSKCELGDNNVISANVVLNEKIDSDFIIKNENKILKEKIIYRG